MALLNLDFSNDPVPDSTPNPVPKITNADIEQFFNDNHSTFLEIYWNYEFCTLEQKELIHIDAWNTRHPLSEKVAKETLIRETTEERVIRLELEPEPEPEPIPIPETRKRGPVPKAKNEELNEAKNQWRLAVNKRKLALAELDNEVKYWKLKCLHLG